MTGDFVMKELNPYIHEKTILLYPDRKGAVYETKKSLYPQI